MSVPTCLGNRIADLRYALRMIRQTPGLSAIAVLSLSLGIGANTAIFSLIDAILLKTLPVPSPEQLYQVTTNSARPRISWSYPDYIAYRDNNAAFECLAAYATGLQPLGMRTGGAESGRAADLVQGALVSGNYFEVLRVGPALGRLFDPIDASKPGAAAYSVLTYECWQRHFNGDPGVIGRKVYLSGYPFQIIGVTPRDFRGADASASPGVFIPLVMKGELARRPLSLWKNRDSWWLQIVGRLKREASVKQAEAELDLVFRSAEESGHAGDSVSGPRKIPPIVLKPAARGYSYVRNRLEKPLTVLMALVALVLLIACVTIASLMLARGVSRGREMAVRLALGATRARLAAQLVMEGIVLASMGGAAGLLLSFWGVHVLLGFVPQPGWTLVSVNVSPDTRVLAFTFIVSVITGVLFGLAPALKWTRPERLPALKEDTPGAAGGSRLALRKALVILQVALSIPLTIGAGLFARSLSSLRDIDAGFRRDNLVFINVDPEGNGYRGQRLRDFYEQLRMNVERLPGVISVSLAQNTPLAGTEWNTRFCVEGLERKPGIARSVTRNCVGPRYFETIGIAMLQGRDFRQEDNPKFSVDPQATLARSVREREPFHSRVAVIDETFAERFFPGRNPLGMHLCLDSDKYEADKAHQIIGVVGDARYFGLVAARRPMVYLPVWEAGTSARTVCIRTKSRTPQLIESVRRAASALDPAIPVLNARTIQQRIDDNIMEFRLVGSLSGFFSVVALLLGSVGLYGVISSSVSWRAREIGIRMALGAQRHEVLRLVVRDAAVLVAAGTILGFAGALATTRTMKTFFYGISAQDPVAIGSAVLLLVATAALATFLPARRASKIDPAAALRGK